MLSQGNSLYTPSSKSKFQYPNILQCKMFYWLTCTYSSNQAFSAFLILQNVFNSRRLYKDTRSHWFGLIIWITVEIFSIANLWARFTETADNSPSYIRTKGNENIKGRKKNWNQKVLPPQRICKEIRRNCEEILDLHKSRLFYGHRKSLFKNFIRQTGQSIHLQIVCIILKDL